MTHSTKLIWITPDAEKVISYCARVSNPANQENYDSAPKLLQYCINHGHWSIFEMASMCVEITTTRSIAAQILRHRSFSFQEFSQRYAEVELRPEIPEFRRQDLKNRQNSTDDLGIDVKAEAELVAANAIASSYTAYQKLIDMGIAKECARDVLPLSTPTRLYMSGTIRSWLHYCNLRTANGTQKEHAYIAAQILELLDSKVPNITAAMFNTF